MLINSSNKSSSNSRQVTGSLSKNFPPKSATFFQNMFIQPIQSTVYIQKNDKHEEKQKNDLSYLNQGQNFQLNNLSKINGNNYSKLRSTQSSLALLARTKEDFQTIYKTFQQKTHNSSEENRFFFSSKNKMLNETKNLFERGTEKLDKNNILQPNSNNSSNIQNNQVVLQNNILKKNFSYNRTQEQNNKSQTYRQTNQERSEEKQTENNNEIINQKVDIYQIKQKFKQARQNKIYSKSQNKLKSSETNSHQLSTAYDSFLNIPQFKQSNELRNYKTNQSYAKNLSFKDTILSQSTTVSQKRSFNFSHFERFPKLDQNILDSEIPSIIENDKHGNHSRSLSQFKVDTKNQNTKRQTEDSSFLFPLKDHQTNRSFQNMFKGLKPIKQVNKQSDNENSMIDHDFVLSMNNDFSSKGNNSSFTNQEKEKSISDQANDMIKKFKKLNPMVIIQDEKLKKLQLLKQKEIQLKQFIKKRNFVEAINIMKDFLVQTSQEKNLENFADTITFLGQLNYFNHDIDNALYSFIQLKHLSEIVGNPQIKMRSLILLGQLFQDEQDYDQALQLYRRAIHYSWYLNDQETEIKMYDKLGFLYFMKGDIQKAKYFHERSISHQTENPKSENMQQSIYTVSKLFTKNNNFIPNLNQMVLAKLGLLTDQQDQLRFSTKISAELQIIILRDDKEINQANHDPSQINPDEKMKLKIIPEGMENVKEYQIIQKILDQKNQFQPIVLHNTQYKDPRSSKIVDKSLLKLTIEEKVQKVKMDVYDDKRLQKKLKEAQVSAIINRQTCNQKFFFNHCTPNRNLLGFKYTFKPNSLKFKNYFQKMENMIIYSDY